VHGADIQDRDGGVLVMSTLFGMFPFLLKLYADSGYQGLQFQQGLMRACQQINVEIVKRSDVGKFVVLPKRWIVERTIGWLNRCRRLAKDWECLNRNALAFLRWASIRLMLRKLCQKQYDLGPTLSSFPSWITWKVSATAMPALWRSTDSVIAHPSWGYVSPS
jgi:transposase